MTATITLTWKHDGAKPTEFRIYRSDAPMDPDDMPEPIGTALPAEREYVNDDSIVEDNTYYYRVGALIGSAERISDTPTYWPSPLFSRSYRAEATPLDTIEAA